MKKIFFIFILLFLTFFLFSANVIDIKYINNNGQYDNLFKKYGKEFNQNWIDLKIQAFIESSFKKNAFNKKIGTIGLMQISPIAFKDIKRNIKVNNLYNPDHNIRSGSYYMQWLKKYIIKKYNSNNIKLSLIAYNYGIGNLNNIIKKCQSLDIEIIKNYLPEETKNYIEKFTYLKNKIKPEKKKVKFHYKDYFSKILVNNFIYYKEV